MKGCIKMKKALEFLKACGTFFLATDEEGQPRVRPFGAVSEYDGKLYICTNNRKPCFAQMKKNPRVELCGMKDGKWIRLAAEAIADDRIEARTAMLTQNPGLRGMYKEDDGIFEVLFLKNATATIASFTDAPETWNF